MTGRRFRLQLSPLLRRFVLQTGAQDLIEYGVLIALIASAMIVGLSGLGAKVPSFYSTTSETMPGEAPANPGRRGNPGNGNPGNGNPVGNPGNENPGRGGGN